MRNAVIVSACALALILSGCTTVEDPGATAPTTTPSPTPTINLGPVQLDTEEAADRYLSIVCPPNATNDALAAAFESGEEEFLNGGAPDPAAVKAAAQLSLDANRASVEFFDDAYFTWPNTVAKDIVIVRDSNLGSLAPLSSMVNAASFEDAYYTSYGDQTVASASAQEIRYQLGLGADTTATCVGFEGGHDTLRTERTEREAALAAAGE